ncbi:MAG TPA: ATP-binding protein [Candidatus Limnocylindrales bacterium]|nr:ATP-binding protein [Candidatus Limnocylindrales bacterium]
MKKLTYERRIQLFALAAGLPGSLIALLLLWFGPYSTQTAWTLTILIAGAWLGFAASLRSRVMFSLQTLSNLLAAMREEDFSLRGRGARPDDSMGEVMIEVNALSEVLRQQRLGALEATALLRTVMEEIDVAVFTFDADKKLKLVNRAGERLLDRPAERTLGLTASELGLGDCLGGEPARTMELSFPGGSGRWGMRRGSFRQGGSPHHLVVLTDLRRALREEERQAWQRLIRVLGHELNNSLAPIQSVAQSLETSLLRVETPKEEASLFDDIRQGLTIIHSRTEALGRFMGAYTQLARLPKPTLTSVDFSEVVHHVAALERLLPASLVEGPQVTIQADRDQLEQLLINIVRNAIDAAKQTHGSVRLEWSCHAAFLDLLIFDEGPGISNPANLFVPFFTTKPGGSGIGLVLSRQIAEAHGGSLTLENRTDGPGCKAHLRLPL